MEHKHDFGKPEEIEHMTVEHTTFFKCKTCGKMMVAVKYVNAIKTAKGRLFELEDGKVTLPLKEIIEDST